MQYHSGLSIYQMLIELITVDSSDQQGIYKRELEKLQMRGKAQRVTRRAETRLQNVRITGPKFIEFL